MLGEKIKEARNLQGKTQEQFSEMIGINRVTLSYIENGTKIPSLALMVKIADELNLSVDWLLGRKEK